MQKVFNWKKRLVPAGQKRSQFKTVQNTGIDQAIYRENN